MLQLLNYAGTITGLLGALLCGLSGISRFTGQYYLGGFEATTLFMLGTGLMVFACLAKLEVVRATLPKV